MNLYSISLHICSAFYVIAGVSHFFFPKFFIRLVPPWAPFPKFIIFASGVFEIVLGFGLLSPVFRSYAVYGIILLLLAVWPAHFFHYTSRTKLDPPKWALLLRIGFQVPLLYWAYSLSPFLE